MAPRFTPRRAVRKGQKARVALSGPSGSGKTWTALETAAILAAGAPVLVVDTERGSASLYADHFTFDVIEFDPPFDPRDLAELLKAYAADYGAIVVDSLSHFWEGEGGTRDIVDAAAARARGNSFAGWKEGTPAQNDMIAALLAAPTHVITTMRSKTEYVLEDRGGKQVPRKVGMAPIQRAGIEYEFTVTAELDWEHTLLIDKTRCHPLAGRMFKLGHTNELGCTLAAWLDSASGPIAVDEAAELVAAMNALGNTGLRRRLKDAFAAKYGRPDGLAAAQLAEARAYIAETRAALEAELAAAQAVEPVPAPELEEPPPEEPAETADAVEPRPEAERKARAGRVRAELEAARAAVADARAHIDETRAAVRDDAPADGGAA